MDFESVVLLGLLLMTMPLLGAVCAMALGVVVALSRAPHAASAPGAASRRVDRVAGRLRAGAGFFGYSVDGVRRLPDRRQQDRREQRRRQRERAQADRRRRDRRLRSRRAGGEHARSG